MTHFSYLIAFAFLYKAVSKLGLEIWEEIVILGVVLKVVFR